MRHVRNLLTVLSLVAVVFLGVAWRPTSDGASVGRVAGAYVKTLARNSGAMIIGDKVWSVRTRDGVTTVAVRVRYKIVDPFFGPRIGVTTIFVHLAKSGYGIVG